MKKSILIVDHDQCYSGSTISLKYIVQELHKDYKLILVTPKQNPENFSAEKFDKIVPIKDNWLLNLHFSADINFISLTGFYSFFLNFIRFFRGTLSALRIIKDHNPDLVIVNEYVILQFNVAARFAKIPNLCFVRSLLLSGIIGFRKKIAQFILSKSASGLVAITKLEADQFGNSIKKIIVPEFLDESDFTYQPKTSEILQKYGLNKDKFIVLMLGGISQIKGTYTYLKNIDIFDFEKFDVFFLLIGDLNAPPKGDSYHDDCIKLISYPSFEKNFKAIPHTTKVKELISICDILVSASSWSHFSRPIIEAWAKKKAVIASDVLHHRNLVKNEDNGLLFKNKDHIDLKRKIEKLLSDEELRNKIALNGYNNAREHFYQKNLDILLNYINKLL